MAIVPPSLHLQLNLCIMQNKESHTCENDGTNTQDHTFKIIADKQF